MILLVLVDAHYKFNAVDIGSYRKNNEWGIFASSKLGKALENGRLFIPNEKDLPRINIPTRYIILGDSGFPVQRNIMRPYPEPQTIFNIEKRIFNHRRLLVEC